MLQDISETAMVNSRINFKKKSQLATGYESDSDGGVFGDDSEDSGISGDEQDGKQAVLDKQETKNENENEEEEEEDDDDDDMFASDKEESETPNNPILKKKKNVLDIDEFEKEQGLDDYEFDEKLNGDSMGRLSGINSPKGPNGTRQEVKLEAFNLREEVESGKFDRDLNYIRREKNDSEEEDEPWMADASSEDIRKAKKAQQQQQHSKLNSSVSSKPVLEILADLILELEPAETPMEAFSRLRPARKKRDRKQVNIDDANRKQTVYRITEFCEQLVNEKGIALAYDMSREELMRVFKNETGEDFQPKGVKRNAEEMEEAEPNDYGDAIWEFRWAGENEINGPYSTYEMKYWKESYFGNNVDVRKLNDPVFRHVSEVSFEEN